MRSVLAFIRLARLPFLFGGFAAFGLGAAVARYDGHALHWPAYLFGQLLVTAFHLMVHFDNDYHDQATDALTARTAWSGGSGVLVSDELSPRVALWAGRACAGAGAALTGLALYRGNLVLGALGVAICACASSYSVPPIRLLARGLGELDAVAVVAVFVPLAGYATFAHAIGAHALLATIPGAIAMFGMMLSVEIPDAAADAATGKRNLVVRWGVPYAAIVARTFATFAPLAVLLVTSAAFAPPVYAYLAVIPIALVALAYTAPHLVAHLAFATIPFLGVMLFGLTTCATLAIVALAS